MGYSAKTQKQVDSFILSVMGDTDSWYKTFGESGRTWRKHSDVGKKCTMSFTYFALWCFVDMEIDDVKVSRAFFLGGQGYRATLKLVKTLKIRDKQIEEEKVLQKIADNSVRFMNGS